MDRRALIGSLAALLAACSSAEEAARDGTAVAQDGAVLFVSEHRTPESPFGLWCVERAGDVFTAKPLVASFADVSLVRGEVLKLGERYWAMFAGPGERKAAPLTGCKVGEALPVDPRDVTWSNVAPVYLRGEGTSGQLRVGVPGRESMLLEAAGVTEFRWSPSQPTAFYLRAAEDPTRSDLFVLEVSAAGDVVESFPLAIAQNVKEVRWSANSEWIVFSSGDQRQISAWSRTRRELKVIAETAGSSLHFNVSADPRVVLVSSTAPTSSGEQAAQQHRLLDLDDGSSAPVLDAAALAGDITWLHPQLWLQHVPRDGSQVALYDFSSGAPGSRLALSSEIALLSPLRGHAMSALGSGQARWISGLPNAQKLVGTVAAVSGGMFSPNGEAWAAFDPGIDAQGRLTGRGLDLQVVRASAVDNVEVVSNFGEAYPSGDGVRWLDDDTVALLVTEPRKQVTVAIARHAESGWTVERIALGTGVSMTPRMFSVNEDPCHPPGFEKQYFHVGCAAADR
jgi:hypothetical protein